MDVSLTETTLTETTKAGTPRKRAARKGEGRKPLPSPAESIIVGTYRVYPYSLQWAVEPLDVDRKSASRHRHYFSNLADALLHIHERANVPARCLCKLARQLESNKNEILDALAKYALNRD